MQEYLIPNSTDEDADVNESGFFVRDRRFYSLSRKGDKSFETELSNCIFKITYHLKDGTQNTKRIISLQRHSGEVTSIEVSSSDLRLDTFEVILKSNRCTFFGNANQLKKIVAHLMDTEEEAIFINLLGWDPAYNIFAFADKIYSKGQLFNINDAGIVNTNDNRYYLPALSNQNINNEGYNKERLYVYKPGNLNFERWAQLFYDAYDINGAVGMQFLILSVFRDIIFKKLQFFPFLFLFGEAGSGKTTYTEFLLRLFGNDAIGTPLNNSTTVALSRIVGRFRNGISYLKEYTAEASDAIQDFILTIYDGSGRETGVKSNDNKTKTFPVTSGIIFDGNFLPSQKTAILSRMILLVFNGKEFSEKQVKAVNILKNNVDDGFAKVLIEILDQRDFFTEHFESVFKKILTEIRSTTRGQLSERAIKHISLLLTPAQMLENKLKLPFNYSALKEKLLDFADRQNQVIKQTDTITVFWEAFDWGISKGSLQQHYQYKLVYPNEEYAELAIKLQPAYTVYISHCRANNIKETDQSSLKMLLCSNSNPYFIPGNQKSRIGKAWTILNFGSAYKFRFDKTENNMIKINDVEIRLPTDIFM